MCLLVGGLGIRRVKDVLDDIFLTGTDGFRVWRRVFPEMDWSTKALIFANVDQSQDCLIT